MKQHAKTIRSIAGTVFSVYGLLLAVAIISAGFKLATGDHAKELFAFASNPIAGLMVGTIATALLQSSSTVTSVIVGLVAGGLPLGTAIPLIMGANIGTTITNTLVSLAHVRDGKSFRRAFAAATIHDFFNYFCVMVFLPIEMAFGLLEKLSAPIAHNLAGADSMSIKGFNFIKPITKPVVGWVKSGVSGFDNEIAGSIMLVIGLAMVVGAITALGRILKANMGGRAQRMLENSMGKRSIHAVISGTVVTILVQSSSTTTSLIIPLAGHGVLSLKQVYPFTLGANIGTTVTALLAATAITGPTAEVAMQIAVVHLLFNVMGVVVLYGNKVLRELPLVAAETLADYAQRNPWLGLIYLLVAFVGVPAMAIMIFG